MIAVTTSVSVSVNAAPGPLPLPSMSILGLNAGPQFAPNWLDCTVDMKAQATFARNTLPSLFSGRTQKMRKSDALICDLSGHSPQSEPPQLIRTGMHVVPIATTLAEH